MLNFSSYIKCNNQEEILKEKYLNKDIFTEGTTIISGDKIGKIIRRGPNYVIALDESKKIFRSWITDIKEYVEEKPKRINKYRNFSYSRDNMDSVKAATIFIGMLPEHSYRVRRTVERTLLEGMSYDSAIGFLIEDLKSQYLVDKAVEYYEACLEEADDQMAAAKQQAQQQMLQMKQNALKQRMQAKQQETQQKMQRQASKAASMGEEIEDFEEVDEARVVRRYSTLNPNEIRQKAEFGSSYARKHRRQMGLPEEGPSFNVKDTARAKLERMSPEQRAQLPQDKVKEIMNRGPKLPKISEEETLRNTNPCWKGYKPIGTKKKGGRTVPNCVPKEELQGNQSKLDVAPPFNKLTAADFKKLRSRKKNMEEQEGIGGSDGVSSGGAMASAGPTGSAGSSKKLPTKKSNWREEISLSDRLVESEDKGNIIINPNSNDCQKCGAKLKENYTCPNCDEGTLRTKYREESYEMIERHMSAAEKAKREKIVMSMKKNLSGFKSRYGKRANDVMYATATKQALHNEEIEISEEESLYGVYDRVRGIFVQTGVSYDTAKAIYQRLLRNGRKSRELAIRRAS